jgi:hypothetical protein
VIRATPEQVWRVLVDARKLAGGAFGITRLEGEIAVGKRLRLWSSVSPGRPFPLMVVQMQPNRLMIWKGGMPFGLFTGTRTFTLSALGDAAEFRMREVYSGPLIPLIWNSIPDLTPSFRQFADALASEAEATG